MKNPNVDNVGETLLRKFAGATSRRGLLARVGEQAAEPAGGLVLRAGQAADQVGLGDDAEHGAGLVHHRHGGNPTFRQ